MRRIEKPATACVWKERYVFWGPKVAMTRSPNIKRRMASAAELKKSCFGEIDKSRTAKTGFDVYSSGRRPILRFGTPGPTKRLAQVLRRPTYAGQFPGGNCGWTGYERGGILDFRA